MWPWIIPMIRGMWRWAVAVLMVQVVGASLGVLLINAGMRELGVVVALGGLLTGIYMGFRSARASV
jgi:hypothetical protein